MVYREGCFIGGGNIKRFIHDFLVKRKPTVAILIIWLVIVLLLILLIDLQLRPIITSVASYQAKVYATRALNNAIATEMISGGVPYESLIEITTGTDGMVSSVTVDTARLNILKSNLTEAATSRISLMEEQNMDIPLGTLIGQQLLSGRGPKISFKIIPIGFVESEFTHIFDDAGINQTRHQISLELEANIMAILPGYPTTTTVTTNVILTDTVIVGITPEAYTKVIMGDETELPGVLIDYQAAPRL